MTASTPADAGTLETRILAAGNEVLAGLTAALDDVPGLSAGPQVFARKLGIDKVLASRFLKAVRAADPLTAVHRLPGPEPMRRVLRGLSRQGVDAAVLQRAARAVEGLDELVRAELGDRSSLDAVLSAWVPEARREFELRRKQAAFRAISQLRGVEAGAIMATVFLHPSPDGEHLDVVWLNGLFGVQRLRPGATVKFATRRMSKDAGERAPRGLDGRRVEDARRLMLPEFCSSPAPSLEVTHVGEVVHYTLAHEEFAPGPGDDIVFCEVNLGEINRYAMPGSRRKAYVFAEVSTPARALHFDAFVHTDAYPRSEPQLRIYDTSFEGVADVNSAARDLDQYDLLEAIQPLGRGVDRSRSADVPRYSDLLRTVCDAMKWDGAGFRGYRCRVDYPIYGSQVAMLFDQEKRLG